MQLGWKVITGTALLAAAQLFSAAMTDCPIPAWIPWLKWLSGLMNAGGLVLTGVGLSSKVATATNNVVESLNRNNVNTLRALGDQKFIDRIIERKVPYVVKRLGPEDEVMIRKGITKDAKEIKKE
jgi:hypothetical protein